MSIYKVGDKWYIDIPTARGRIRRSARTTDKREAQAYHDKIRGELWRLERLGEKPPITWGEAVKKWLEVKPRGMPDRYRLRSINLDVSASLPLSLPTLENALRGYKGSTYNRALGLVSAIHSCASVKMPTMRREPSPAGRTRWLTAEEWQRLRKALQSLSPLLAQCAEFAINTGLRENNVLNLEWSQVDLRRKVAWIHGDQAKAGQPIGIPLNEGAMAVLEARRGCHKVFVFANPDTGLPYYKASSRKWYEALKKARLTGFRWHDLRHTFFSWAAMSGVSLNQIKDLGGWKTYAMTLRYAHFAAEHLAEASSMVKPVSIRYNKPKKAN